MMIRIALTIPGRQVPITEGRVLGTVENQLVLATRR